MDHSKFEMATDAEREIYKAERLNDKDCNLEEIIRSTDFPEDFEPFWDEVVNILP